MTLGQTIFAYRKKAGLSQEELAGRVGVSRQSVSKWELDESSPEVSKLKTLAAVFGITVDRLLSGEGPEEDDICPCPEESDEGGEPRPREDGFDRMTGLLGRLIRRYGWLAGVFVALGGAGTALVGAIARFAFSSMARTAQSMMSGLGGVQWEVTGGGDLPPEVLAALGISPSPVSSMASIPVTIATVILVVGLVTAVAGVILALYLRRRSK